MPQATVVEAKTERWKFKATVTTAVIVAIVGLAFLFRLEFGILLLTIGSAVTYRAWNRAIHARNERRQELRRAEAGTRILEAEAEQAEIETRRQRIASSLHETRAGVFYFHTESNYDFLPATAAERKQLAASVIEEDAPNIDLLKVLTQEQSVFAVIGRQRVGKSWQAMHVADDWLSSNIRPVVIGKKCEVGEWQGCRLLISQDPNELGAALESLVKLQNLRHQGKKARTPLPVFLDDWVWTVSHVDFAQSFIGEAGTTMASANIILYFLIQTDTRDAYGAGSLGAMLKDNFTRLYLRSEFDEDGVPIAGQAKGFLVYPNERDERPVTLFKGKPKCVALVSAPEVEPQAESEVEISMQLVPDSLEARIIELYQAGENLSTIAEEVYGSKGGPQNKKIKAILAKFGKV